MDDGKRGSKGLPPLGGVQGRVYAFSFLARLRAGVPTIIVPHVGDQKFWGELVARLGVGPKPVARHHLSSTKLADLLTAVGTNQEMQRRAQEVGAELRKENGVGQAVKAIQAYVASQKK